MSSTQQTRKEKVRVTLEDNAIPESELTDLITDVGEPYPDPQDQTKTKESIWQKSGDTDFLNTPLIGIRSMCPTFYNKMMEQINKPEHKDKTVNLTFRGFLFGVRQTSGFDLLWKVKSNNGIGGNTQAGAGGGQGKGFPPAALEEIYFDTWEGVNLKLKENPNARWYIVDQYVETNMGQAMCYVTIKRNRYFPSPTT